ncbi:alpha/beta fold hydrolase [Paenisporosarcina indica]|uniref:alpha/beta fold hydrolase n=1 Tax=Paenisporosarcina indica TaxID=650093 RepID=UPI00094FC45B|nr:alpha/beta hydrolase [Paenisporosarcina indica]
MLLNTEVFGSGEPIVFLHTGLQTGLTDFEYQREYFQSTYKVILPDLRGHGKSIESNFTNFFEDSANDLVETFDLLGVESAHIVGCSLGALAGLFLAKKYPHKVKSLTISGVLAEKPENWLDLHNEDVASQSQLLQNDDAINYFNQLHSSDWRQFLYIGRDEDWYPFNETKNLDGILSPILYMVGEGNKGETIGAILYPQMKENVHVSIIPFASHLVHSEQPEIYTKVLDVFLQKIDKL